MSVRVQVLNQTLQALRQAASRLRATHGDLTAHFPLTPARLNAMSQIDQERLDALAVRYARCQDLLAPAMRALARAQLEPKADASFLGLHALMQKQGIATTTADWERQRSLRNAVGHEYPDTETIAELLNGIQADIPAILSMVERLSQVGSALIAEHR